MIRLSLLFLVLAAVSLNPIFTGCAHKPKDDPIVSKEFGRWFGSAKVTRFHLRNGLKAIVIEDHSAPTFAYQTWFNVGSMDEVKGRTGLAHLFEHMMFKATKNHPEGEFDKILESVGVEEENAFTNRDYTAYVQSLPKNSKTLDLIMNLESDRMVNLVVDKNSLDREREVVQNERRFRNENSPDGTMYERIYELAFRDHSYHWPVIGYEKDLAEASPEDCMQFYKRFYAPNNATVIISGDITADEVEDGLRKYYVNLPPSNIQRNERKAEPEQNSQRAETMHLKLQVEKAILAYHVPPVLNEDTPAIELLSSVLTTGKSSRLYKKLIDSGVATEVDTYMGDHKDPGLFMFFVTLQKGHHAKQAEQIIESELRSVQKRGITDEELQRTLNLAQFSLLNDITSNSKKAHFIGSNETILGNYEKGIDYFEQMKRTTSADVVRVANKYFNHANQTSIFGVPEKGGK